MVNGSIHDKKDVASECLAIFIKNSVEITEDPNSLELAQDCLITLVDLTCNIQIGFFRF